MDDRQFPEHDCNTVPVWKRDILGRRKRMYRCIHCNQLYPTEQRMQWWDRATLDRKEAIQFERDIETIYSTDGSVVGYYVRNGDEWTYEVDINEHGAWIGCQSIYMIEELP